MSKNSNYIRQKIILSTLFISMSIAAQPVYADYPPQNSNLGSALGTALGSFLKSRTRGAGNQTQNLQASASSSQPLNKEGLCYIKSAACPNPSEPDAPDPAATMGSADQQLMANGMWRDPKTGLVWMRCTVWRAKPWNGASTESQCPSIIDNPDRKGSVVNPTQDWAENMIAASKLQFGGHNDWRIPTTLEIASLLQCEVWTTNSDSHIEPIRVESYTANSIKLGCGTANRKEFVSMQHLEFRPNLPVSPTMSANIISPNQYYYFSPDRSFDFSQADGGDEGFAVRGGHPDGLFEQNLIVAKKIIEDRHNKDVSDAAYNKAAHADYDAQQKLARQQAQQRQASYVKFRRTLKRGDSVHAATDGDVSQALILQVDGDLVLIQMSYGDKWVNRSVIYP